MKLIFIILFSLIISNLPAQTSADTAISQRGSSRTSLDSLDRRSFSFLTNVPRDILVLAKTPFRKKNLDPLLITVGITAVLLPIDQIVIDHMQGFARRNSIDSRIQFKELVTISKSIGIRLPKNLNTAFYQMGESTPALLFAGGFFVHGLISKNKRSKKTAADITEAFLVSGITVQLLKRISGRQQPVAADVNGGRWRPFPSLRKYNDEFSQYGAYPSGHLATMMSVVTVIAENYPEKKWVRPVGYSLISLTGIAMINNGAHWISDYPLGIAIGYMAGKIASHRKSKKKIKKSPTVVM